MKNKTVIIWGYKQNNHTQHFVHWGWFNAFKSLGYETHWFSDEDYPIDFDYNNCIFIGEGYREKNIPLIKSSIYVINFLINPEKYVNANVRIIDLRLNVSELNDCNYNYIMSNQIIEKIDECVFYEKKASDEQLSDKYKRGIKNYEAIYMSWATHLLPEEIDYESVYIPRERIIHYTGSIGESNIKEINNFKVALEKEGIPFNHINPWSSPASWDTLKDLTQRSFMAPDLRGTAFRMDVNGKPDNGGNHKLIGYIPCRIFKNISFGQLGVTNSKKVFELFEGNLIYNDNEYDLFFDAIPKLNDYSFIKNQMKFVKEKHTFYNRINALCKLI